MSCPACGRPRSRPSVRSREYAFRRCATCATLFLHEPPDPERTASLYAGPEYFANPRFSAGGEGGYHGYKDYVADSVHIERKFGEVLRVVERFRAPGTLLDVGAGPGFLLREARRRGWRGHGLDLNPWAVQQAALIGEDVRRGALPLADARANTLDAVTMMDVLEHVRDPAALVADAARQLRPGGVLAVLTPDAGSPVSRALGSRWPEVQRAPEHIVLFSVRGLGRLLERHGLRPVGWHSVGKASTVGTLVADVAPTAGRLGTLAARLVEGRALADRELEIDPRTKFVLYAVHGGCAPDCGPRPLPVPRLRIASA